MFVGLHNHDDNGSNIRGFLDSINTVKGLITYTKELGHAGVAITDHDSIAAHVDALTQMDELRQKDPEKWKDYKLILGNEIYLCKNLSKKTKNIIFIILFFSQRMRLVTNKLEN